MRYKSNWQMGVLYTTVIHGYIVGGLNFKLGILLYFWNFIWNQTENDIIGRKLLFTFCKIFEMYFFLFAFKVCKKC